MGFRTLIITNNCKISYKDGYLIIRNEEVQMVHLSEIYTILIDTTMATITTYCIAELVKRKIKVIFCDEERNPTCELTPYYGSHNTSKRIHAQILWDEKIKCLVWTSIVKQKIYNQIDLLKKCDKDEYKLLLTYYDDVKDNDSTNREGHAAKVYFNALYGKSFTRNEKNDVNSALDYGYTILLSSFNKEIVARGFITQIGINHNNEFNYFNLACDLMEPFRTFVDSYVYKNQSKKFNSEYKKELVDILNKKVVYMRKVYHLNDCIGLYVKNVTETISNGTIYKDNIYFAYEL